MVDACVDFGMSVSHGSCLVTRAKDVLGRPVEEDDAEILIGSPMWSESFNAQNACEWIEEQLARLEGRQITEAEAA